jgi:allophanate hydrolase subunit 2
VGGYVKIATVITSDLGVLAQTVPGDTVRFIRVDLKTAHSISEEASVRMGSIIDYLSR